MTLTPTAALAYFENRYPMQRISDGNRAAFVEMIGRIPDADRKRVLDEAFRRAADHAARTGYDVCPSIPAIENVWIEEKRLGRIEGTVSSGKYCYGCGNSGWVLVGDRRTGYADKWRPCPECRPSMYAGKEAA